MTLRPTPAYTLSMTTTQTTTARTTATDTTYIIRQITDLSRHVEGVRREATVTGDAALADLKAQWRSEMREDSTQSSDRFSIVEA